MTGSSATSLSLARKHRPQRFAELAGQAPVAELLRRAVHEGQVRPAYIFAGTRGVGKTSSARILARAVNCTNSLDGEPCNACDSCIAIMQGRASDVLEIDAASYTKVEQTREVLSSVAFRPASLRFRVYIIDEAHMLSKSSFNALLKTLEEPPSHALFVLATTEPDKIPDTVRSRCQKYHFSSLETRALADLFSEVLGSEGATCTESAMARITAEANGSVRDGLTLIDQILTSTRHIDDESLQAVLGQLSQNHIQTIIHGLLTRNPAQVTEGLDTLLGNGATVAQVGKTLLDHLQSGVRWLVLPPDKRTASTALSDPIALLWEGYGLANAFRLTELVFSGYEKALHSPVGPGRLTLHLLRVATLAPLEDVLHQTTTPSLRPASVTVKPVSDPPAAQLEPPKPLEVVTNTEASEKPAADKVDGTQDILDFKDRVLGDTLVRGLVENLEGTVENIQDLRGETPEDI